MQIIEYFNFKNKPLTKEERNSIKIQIDEFMTHFDNSTQNNDLNNPILNEVSNCILEDEINMSL